MSTNTDEQIDTSVLESLDFELLCEAVWFKDDGSDILAPDGNKAEFYVQWENVLGTHKKYVCPTCKTWLAKDPRNTVLGITPL